METLLNTQAEVSRAIKAELRATWPRVKWSVRGGRGGGSSVSIHWTNGPTEKAVSAVLGKYEVGHFDGMTDCYNYDTDPEVYCDAAGNVANLGGVQYVFCAREYALDGAPGDDVCPALAADLGAVMGWAFAGDIDAQAPWSNNSGYYNAWRQEIYKVIQASTLTDGLHGIRARADRGTNSLAGIAGIAEAY